MNKRIFPFGITFFPKNKSPLRIFAYGTLVSAIILGAALLFLNQPQCPSDWYQTGATDCITGANIGFGMAVMLAIGIWIITIVVCLARYAKFTIARKDASKWESIIQIILVVATSALVAYLVISFLLYYLGMAVDDGYRGSA